MMSDLFVPIPKKDILAFIGLFIILASLPLAVLLLQRYILFLGQAENPPAQPTNLNQTNIHGHGFSLSWTSEEIKETTQTAKPQAQPIREENFVKGELLIKFKPHVNLTTVSSVNQDYEIFDILEVSEESLPDSIKTINQKYGSQSFERVFKGKQETTAYNFEKYFILKFREETNLDEPLEIIKKDTDNIEYVSLNYYDQIDTTVPNDPRFRELYGLEKLRMTLAWDVNKGRKDLVVGVSDTGLEFTHEDLQGQIYVNPGEDLDHDGQIFDPDDKNGRDDDGNGFIDDFHGWNFVSNNNEPKDGNLHGTHVSGTIGAATDNAKGVAGINWYVSIMPVKNCDDGGGCPYTSSAAAIKYAADKGAKVINMSWGGSHVDPGIKSAVEYAHSKGVVLVGSAGNSGREEVKYPSGYKQVIAVSATDQNDRIAHFSTYGNQIEVAAPGVDILSLTKGNGYEKLSGTSMAAPHTSGLATLILAQNPSYTNDQVRQKLKDTADDLDPPGKDKYYGYGRINACKALDCEGPPEKKPPVCNLAAAPTEGRAPLQVNFDGGDSYDPDGGEITDFAWEFGDGETAKGKKVSHIYKSPKEYVAKLTVTDDERATASCTKAIRAGGELEKPEFVATSGSIIYGKDPNKLDKEAFDERGKDIVSTTHHINVTGLEPNTTYYYKIKSGPDLWGRQPGADKLVRGGAAIEIKTGPSLAKESFVPGEIIIKLKQESPPLTKDKREISTESELLGSLDQKDLPKALKNLEKETENITLEKVFKGGTDASDSSLERYYKITIEEEADVLSLVEDLKKDKNIEAVGPNYYLEVFDTTPNDPSFDLLWGLKKIKANRAWDVTTGSRDIVVGVTDTGLWYKGSAEFHEDLKENIWKNEDEIPDNKVDDDKNGFIDDTWGWNFINNTNNPLDDNFEAFHGTHVSGTIGAVGNNNLGVAGVTWSVQIMPVKMCNLFGRCPEDAAANAIKYATDNDAKIINMSWGGPWTHFLIEPAIKYAYAKGVLLVAAAGNSGREERLFPAAYDEVIAVAATNLEDKKAYYSSVGNHIELAAPGGSGYRDTRDIYSTMGSRAGKDSYGYLAGTSMASPHVAGLAVLVWSKFPNLSRNDLRGKLHTSVDDLGDPGKDKYFGYGRINACKALGLTDCEKLSEPPPPPPPPSPPGERIPDPAYGYIKDATGKRLPDVLVYVRIVKSDKSTSAPLSDITLENEGFVIDLANSRTEDIKSYFDYKREEDSLEITVQGAQKGYLERKVIIPPEDKPLEDIIITPIGEDPDFPETTITKGPSEGEIIKTPEVTFEYTGSDNKTPVEKLVYSYRLDEASWSDFSLVTKTTLKNLANGDHKFEVRAKDESENIDPTPATRNFKVQIEGGNKPPKCLSLKGEPDEGPFPLTVKFTGSGEDSDGRVVAYLWDFGSNGEKRTPEDNTEFIYERIGEYKATLKVEDDKGAISENTCSKMITVTSKTPVIEKIEPSSGKVGDVVNIIGRNFGSNGTVHFGEIRAIIISYSDTRITVKVPEGLEPGEVSVAVEVGGVVSNEVKFNVLSLGPNITNVTPPSGKNNEIVKLEITGTDFAAGARVTLHPKEGRVVEGKDTRVPSATKITTTLDLNGLLGGTWHLRVTNPDNLYDEVPFEVVSPGTTLSFKIKFQGIKDPRGPNKFVKLTFLETPLKDKNVEVYASTEGIYQGIVNVENLGSGTYEVEVKGPAHLKETFLSRIVSGQINYEDWSKTPLKAGDINGDGIIEAADLALVIKDYDISKIVPEGTITDLNDDKRVEAVDLALVIANYNPRKEN